MNKTVMIILLIISIIGFAGSIFVSVTEFSASNVMLSVLLLAICVYFAWSIKKQSNSKQSN